MFTLKLQETNPTILMSNKIKQIGKAYNVLHPKWAPKESKENKIWFQVQIGEHWTTSFILVKAF